MRKNVNNDESKDSPISDAKKKKDGLYKIQTVKLKLNYHIISIQIGIIFNLYKNVPSIFTHNKDFLATRSSNGNR